MGVGSLHSTDGTCEAAQGLCQAMRQSCLCLTPESCHMRAFLIGCLPWPSESRLDSVLLRLTSTLAAYSDLKGNTSAHRDVCRERYDSP